MGKSEKTCDQLYRMASAFWSERSEGTKAAFAAGFIVGQAEKVYLGACRAAMLRPEPDDHDWVLAEIGVVANLYGLLVQVNRDKEIWLCRDERTVRSVRFLDVAMPRNDSAWHHLRASLCGIPVAEVDPNYHERAGHRERTDGPEGTAS